MDRGAWKKPVVLEMYGRPGVIQVEDTLDAALLLLRNWHARITDTHRTAVLTCRDVLKGKATPGLARAVFIDAALDAGYHILPETFLDERWGPAPASSDDKPQIASRPEVAGSRSGNMPTGHIRHPQAAYALRPGPTRISELLGQLGETLLLIAVEILRGAAGLLNIEVRRKPNRQMR